jgi:penicillin-binding protein 2
VYDHQGLLLLGNRDFFDLIVLAQYSPNLQQTFSDISTMFRIPLDEIQRRYKDSSANPAFFPLRVKRNLSFQEVALFEVNRWRLPGVDVQITRGRDYTTNAPAHLFGSLGEVTSRELGTLNAQDPENPYYIGSTVGKSGIEKKYEPLLRGQDGRKVVFVDARGRLQSATSLEDRALNFEVVPKRLHDITLTIDQTLQQVASQAFQNKNGALCAMNPQTGEILAYLSHPNYNLEMYQEGLKRSDWQALRSNPFHPLLDKVTGGAYPPGSTHKAVVALAALEEGVITPERRFHCPGYFTLGSTRWRCWKKQGHGSMDMVSAIEQSCDVYFYNVGYMMGPDPLAKWMKLFGMGEPTGLDLNQELPGLVPTPAWKWQTRKDRWAGGDSVNCAIGQGFNLATPLQMLHLYTAMGNGGRLYKPYVVKNITDVNTGKIIQEFKPELIRQIPLDPSKLAVVQQGLYNVVESPTGTAKRARVPGVTVSGKTGTVQTVSAKFTEDRRLDDLAHHTRDHAWFVCYSPSDVPQIAVVVFSEYDGGGGGANAAPIAQQVLAAYWQKHGIPNETPS